MEVYRLSKEKYGSSLDGKGAGITGGRWNSKGFDVIYVATNRALAMAEVLVHLGGGMVPDDYMLITIFVPDNISLFKINLNDLPIDWDLFPHQVSTQTIGDKLFTENKYCVIQAPSAVVKGDYILLINPNHKDFARVKVISVENFQFDKRVIR